jgi:hypothetical protein
LEECVITVHVGTVVVCDCPFQGDINGDFSFDPVDLGAIIDVLFFNGNNVQDGLCPTFRADLNNDGSVDPVDLGYMIDLLFFNGPNPVDPCP